MEAFRAFEFRQRPLRYRIRYKSGPIFLNTKRFLAVWYGKGAFGVTYRLLFFPVYGSGLTPPLRPRRKPTR